MPLTSKLIKHRAGSRSKLSATIYQILLLRTQTPPPPPPPNHHRQLASPTTRAMYNQTDDVSIIPHREEEAEDRCRRRDDVSIPSTPNNKASHQQQIVTSTPKDQVASMTSASSFDEGISTTPVSTPAAQRSFQPDDANSPNVSPKRAGSPDSGFETTTSPFQSELCLDDESSQGGARKRQLARSISCNDTAATIPPACDESYGEWSSSLVVTCVACAACAVVTRALRLSRPKDRVLLF